MQLSVVSRTVASAAASYLGTTLGLLLVSAILIPLLARSSLMQRWATLVASLTLWDQDSYLLPELPAFLQKATCLQHLTSPCHTALAAAQASCVLHSCGAESVEVHARKLACQYDLLHREV